MKRDILLIFLLSIVLVSCEKDKETKFTYHKPEVKTSEFTDSRDNNVYKCVEVNGQVWMAENFRFRPKANSVYGCYTYHQEPRSVTASHITQAISWVGKKFPADLKTTILERIDKGVVAAEILLEFEKDFPETFFLYLDNAIGANPFDENYYKEYGLLYTLAAAKRYTPDGWRLPTDEDWSQLEKSLGMPDEEIHKLDEWRGDGLAHGLKEDADGIGFNVKYAGARLANTAGGYGTRFFNKGSNTYFWSSSTAKVDTTNYAVTRVLFNRRDAILRGTSLSAGIAYSVRYIKNK